MINPKDKNKIFGEGVSLNEAYRRLREKKDRKALKKKLEEQLRKGLI